MLAKDLMRRDIFTVREDDLVAELIDALMGEHIHGAPVVTGDGELVGIVSQQDIFFSRMTRDTPKAGSPGEASPEEASPEEASPEEASPEEPGFDETPATNGLRVSEIMTAPAVHVSEETEVTAVCRMMFRLRIHRLPVVRDGKLAGIISSLDICGAVASGKELG